MNQLGNDLTKKPVSVFIWATWGLNSHGIIFSCVCTHWTSERAHPFFHASGWLSICEEVSTDLSDGKQWMRETRLLLSQSLHSTEGERWKRPWCWERLKAKGKEGGGGWDGWLASPTQWTWVWANSGRQWRTRRPGVLQFVGSKRVGYDLATELNWTKLLFSC